MDALRLGPRSRRSGPGRATRSLPALAALALAPVLLAAGPPGAVAPAASGAGGVTTISVAGVPVGTAIDAATGTAYVALRATTGTADEVAVISLATDTVTATVPLSEAPDAIAVDPATDLVYAVLPHDDSVAVISGASNTVTATVTGLSGRVNGSNGIAVDATTDEVYVGVIESSGLTGVAAINGATNAVTSIVSSRAGEPEGIAVDPGTGTVYAAFESLANGILVIDAASGSVSAIVSVPSDPRAVAVNPAAGDFYVALYGESVAAYDEATDAPAWTASVGGLPGGLAVNTATGSGPVYATAGASANDAVLVSGSTGAVTGTVPLTAPGVIAVDPAASVLVAGDGPGTVAIITLSAPAITSAAKATFTTGHDGSFTVQATGTPAPTFSASGALPGGVTLSAAGVLSGTPQAHTGGVYHFTITAASAISPAARQAFTLTVDQAPAFTSPNHAGFRAGVRGSFTIRTSGYPAASVTHTGGLPRGLRFTAHAGGTATITGTPAKSAKGKKFVLHLTASNHVGRAATQTLTLRVS
jgi:DNA-binding beta-propeller fold protein YncE